MLKMRKFLATVLSLCMILSTISIPMVAGAAQELQVSYLNADNSAIHVEFNQGVKVADLQNYLSITVEGQEVNYTVVPSAVAGKDVYLNYRDYDAMKIKNNRDYNGATVVMENNVVLDGQDELYAKRGMDFDRLVSTTYTIVPADGIAYDKVYVLAFKAGLKSADNNFAVSKDFKKGIKVTEIVTDTFDYASVDVSPWWTHGGKTDYTITDGVLTTINNESNLTINNASGKKVGNYTAGDQRYFHNWKNGSGPENYTIAIKAKPTSYSFSIVANWQGGAAHSFQYDDTNFIEFGMDNGVRPKATVLYKDGDQLYRTYMAVGDVSANPTLYRNPETFREYKVSTMGTEARFFVENQSQGKYTNIKADNKGLFFVRGVFSIDELVITTAEVIDFKDLEITYWNADNSAFHFEFNDGKAVNDLADYLTIKQGGKAVAFTVKSERLQPNSQNYQTGWNAFDNAEGTFDNGVFYSVIPTDGMKLDQPYVVEFKAGLALADGTGTLSESFRKGIKVRKIAYEEFNYDTAEGPYLSKTPAKFTVNTGELVLNPQSEHIAIGLHHGANVGNFADTGISGREWTQTQYMGNGEEDYTLSAKVKMVGDGETEFRMVTDYIVNDSKNWPSEINENSGVSKIDARWSHNYYLWMYTRGGHLKDGTENTVTPNYLAIYPSGRGPQSLSDTYKEVKILAKDGYVRWMLDNTTVNAVKGLTLPNKGTFAIGAAGNNVYYVDDLYITKAEEFEIIDFELSYWNADTSAFHLEFNNGIAVKDIEDYITIRKGAKVIPYTVKSEHIGTDDQKYLKAWADATDNEGTFDNGVFYSLLPEGGVELDTPYSVEIKAGLALADNSAALEETIKKGIKVRKIAHEGFDYETANGPYLSGNMDRFTVNTGEMVITPNGANVGISLHYGTNAGTFGDTGIASNAWQTSWGKGQGEEDITVSLKAKKVGEGQGRFYLVANHQYDGNRSAPWELGENSGTNKVQAYWYDDNMFWFYVRGGHDKSGAAYDIAATSEGYRVTAKNSTKEYSLSDEYKEVKLVTKDGHIRFMLDNTTLNAVEGITYSNTGTFTIGAGNNNTYYVDDLYITKAEECEVPDIKEFELTYWNADNSAFHLEFNDGAAVKDLDKYLELRLNGRVVNYTVKAERKAHTAQSINTGWNAYDNAEGTFDNGTFYTIIPTGGVKLDEVYTLELKAGLSTDDAVVEETITKHIKVRKIAHEGFDYDTENGPYLSKTQPKYTVNTGELVLNPQGEHIAIGLHHGASVGNFADTGISGRTWTQTQYMGNGEEDYTLSAKVKMVGDGQTEFRMVTNYIVDDSKNWPSEINENSGVSKVDARWSHHHLLWMYVRGGLSKDGTENTVTPNYRTDYPVAKGDYSLSDSYKEVKLLAKDGKVRWMLDNATVSAVKGLTLPHKGTFAIGAAGDNVYYVDDLYITKAEEVTNYVEPEIKAFDLSYWNADNSAIHLEFNDGAEVNNLKDYLTLENAGKEIKYTIKTDKSEPTAQIFLNGWNDYTDAEGTFDNGTFYTIIPEGGMKIESTYTIKIAEGLETVDGLSKLEEELKKVIKVQKIAYEPFNYDTAEGPYLNRGGSYTVNTGELVMKPENVEGGMGVSLHYGSYMGIFADTGMQGRDWTMKQYKGNGEEDYTVSVKVRKGGNAETKFGIISNYQMDTNTTAPTQVNEHAGTNKVSAQWYSDGMYWMYVRGGHTKSGEVNDIAGVTPGYRTTAKTNDYALSTDTYKEFKLLAKDGKARMMLDNVTLQAIEGLTLPNKGTFTLMAGGNNVYYVDDLYITKAVEIDAKPLDITYWNADNSAIHLEFNDGVKVSNIEESLTLTMGGENVPYTVKAERAPHTAQSINTGWNAFDNAEGEFDNGTIYTIIPTAGITLDKPYKISIAAGLASADGSSFVYDNIEKLIKVRKIAYEAFNYDTAEGPYLSKAQTKYTVNTGELVLMPQSEHIGVGLHHGANLGEFADTGISGREWTQTQYKGNGEENYTVSAKVKMVGDGQTEFRMVTNYIVDDSKNWPSEINENSGVSKIDARWSHHHLLWMYTRGGHLKDGTENTVTPNYRTDYPVEKGEKYSLSDSYREVKIVAKDGKVRWMLDNVTVSAVKGLTLPHKGTFAIGASGTNTYYVDDLYITKAEEVTGGPIEITYWNADNSAIHVEFNDGVKVENIENFLTVKEGGKAIKYTVKAEKSEASKQQYLTGWNDYDNAEGTFDNGTLYSIIPADGIKFDTTYEVKLGAGMQTADGVGLVSEDLVKAIKVKKIAYDPFNYDTVEGPYMTREMGNFGIYGGEMVVTPAGTTTGLTLHYGINTGNFGDTGMQGREWTQKYYKQEGEENYTVSAKVKMVGEKETKFSIITNFEVDGTNNAPTETAEHAGYNKVTAGWYNNNITWMYVRGGHRKDGEENDTTVGYRSDAKTEDYKLTDSYKEVKLLAKDGNVRLMLDNVTLNAVEGLTNDKTGTFTFSIGGENTYYIDDLYITKAVEVDSIDKGNLSLVWYGYELSEEEYGFISGYAPLDFKVGFNNYTSEEQHVTAILALYSGNKMVGSQVVDIDVPMGSADIEFKEVDTSEAETFKIFVFDGIESLGSYFDYIPQ